MSDVPHDSRSTSRSDDPDVPVSVMIGILGAVCLVVLIVVLQAVFYHAEEGERQRKVVSQPSEELSRLRAEQQELLASYGFLDRGKGVVHIPIELAMELEVARAQADAPVAGDAGHH